MLGKVISALKGLIAIVKLVHQLLEQIRRFMD